MNARIAIGCFLSLFYALLLSGCGRNEGEVRRDHEYRGVLVLPSAKLMKVSDSLMGNSFLRNYLERVVALYYHPVDQSLELSDLPAPKGGQQAVIFGDSIIRYYKMTPTDGSAKITLSFDNSFNWTGYRPRFCHEVPAEILTSMGEYNGVSAFFVKCYPDGNFFEYYESGATKVFARFDRYCTDQPQPCIQFAYAFDAEGHLVDSLFGSMAFDTSIIQAIRTDRIQPRDSSLKVRGHSIW